MLDGHIGLFKNTLIDGVLATDTPVVALLVFGLLVLVGRQHLKLRRIRVLHLDLGRRDLLVICMKMLGLVRIGTAVDVVHSVVAGLDLLALFGVLQVMHDGFVGLGMLKFVFNIGVLIRPERHLYWMTYKIIWHSKRLSVLGLGVS